MKDRRREAGIIEDVQSGTEDHGIKTVYIYFKYDGGGVQGFGGLMLGRGDDKDNTSVNNFIADVCSVFGVSRLEQLKGKRGYALKCFGGFNETIEGLESEYGRRFTLTSWRKKYFKDIKSPFEERKESLERDIQRSQERIEQQKQELKTLKKDYKDWDK